MTAPVRRTVATLSALALAGTLVLGTSHLADAGSLITGKAIKNGSVTGKDVKDGSLAVGDFRAGQLPAGPAGPAGAAGKDLQPPTVVSWTGTAPADDRAFRGVRSAMTVPARSVVTGVSLTTTDLRTSCPGGFQTRFVVDAGGDEDAYIGLRSTPDDAVYDQMLTGDEPRSLQLFFACRDVSRAVVTFPAVTFTATFSYSTLGTPTSTWPLGTVFDDD